MYIGTELCFGGKQIPNGTEDLGGSKLTSCWPHWILESFVLVPFFRMHCSDVATEPVVSNTSRATNSTVYSRHQE